MATISEELTKLETTKADIKSALVEKGLNPTDVFSSYALNIRDILSGGSSEPINAVSVNYSNYNSIVWPTNWADVKLIVIENMPYGVDYISLPDLTTDINPRVDVNEVPVIVLLSSGIRLNWNLTLNVNNTLNKHTNYWLSVPYDTSKSSFNTEYLFNITINGDNIARSGGGMFQNLFGNINITFNNTPIDYCERMFNNITILKVFSITGLDTSLCWNFSFMFLQAKTDLMTPTVFKSLDTSNGKQFLYMFSNCDLFNEIEPLDTSKGTQFRGMFEYNKKVIKVNELSVKSCTDNPIALFNTYGTNSTARYVLIKDISTASENREFNMVPVSNWGVEDASIPLSAGARKSLTDSLITYSFDRAAAGYSACKITLSTNTKALLTEEEIAQITAKGFTIA